MEEDGRIVLASHSPLPALSQNTRPARLVWADDYADPRMSDLPAGTLASDPFAHLRPRLFAIAYRRLGARADAQDVLQDAWPVTVTTRLAIDRLRAAWAEREHDTGWWLARSRRVT